MASFLQTLLRDLQQLIRSESGDFQTYDRKIELINSLGESSVDAQDRQTPARIKAQSGAQSSIYFQSSTRHRSAPLNPGGESQ